VKVSVAPLAEAVMPVEADCELTAVARAETSDAVTVAEIAIAVLFWP
jgi:hypothetical protein